MRKKETYRIIRETLLEAVKREAEKDAFKLSGRGHEPRVQLDRQLAAILRGLDLPRVNKAGYGADYYYPERVFVTAQQLLQNKLKESQYQLVVNRRAYLTDKETENFAQRLAWKAEKSLLLYVRIGSNVARFNE